MKKKIIELFKETKAGLFISLCFSFMIMMYEPLNIFVSNRSDFDFDIYFFFPLLLIQTLICFIVLYLLFIISKAINKSVYKIVTIVFLIGLIYSYIQGNYLAGTLPGIDGEKINLSNFTIERIISAIILLIIISVIIFVFKKYKFEMIEKVSKYSSLVIIAMLAVSMISFPLSKNFFKKAVSYYATDEYVNEISSDKNFIIFLLDAIDSQKFNKELEKLGRTETLFEDFTYFPDTLGGYPYTRNSIPFIFSGEWYENEVDFGEYISKALSNSDVFNKLESDGYLLNFYERDLSGYNGDNHERLRNLKEVRKFDYGEVFKEEMKVVFYKYLPFQLKPYTNAETFDIKVASDKFSSNNKKNYNRLKNVDYEVLDDKVFQFIHLEGAHNPQRYDIDLNVVENGTHEGNMDACITLIETFLNKLKDNNLYDNSVIVIMSDHGYNTNYENRQNPILYIKGINERHEYKVSSKKVSYINLKDAFIDLASDKKSDELFEGLDNSVRRYFKYKFTKEDTLYEMEQTGNAWNTTTLKETGNVYKR